ncbi:Flagellar attachment zone 1 [Gossypium australe]|uniref:Flagellar attachment zone 1 n=1 Tax=Gossypium australe TaxID=47621 RepID=A0A5B6WBH1_9ROSI|nr:Flagellar attachment zone 1 [Gossypium australe]
MAAEFPGTPGTSESSVADAPLEDVQVSRCCLVWKNKYSKAERGRVFLKQGIRILEKGYDDIQAENLTLKKAYEEEQALTKVEKEGREKELALRVSLENELSVLKSEISNLKKKGASDIEDKIEEIKQLKARVSDMNKEISWLKELVEKEKKRADLEKRKAAEASTYAATEKGKAGEEHRLKQLETLRKDVSEAKSKLDSEKSKFDEETKKLQEEKKKAVEERKLVDLEMAKASELRKIAEETKKKAVDERKCADLEMAKAEKQRKIAKETKKKAVEERKRADLEMAEAVKQREIAEENMRKAVEVRKQADIEMAKAEEQRKIAEENKKAVEGAKVEEQRKVVEATKKKAVKEKLHNNNLTKQLEQARRRNEELHKNLHELSGSRNMEEAPFDQPDRNTIAAKTEKTAQFKVLKEDADKSRAVSGSLQVEDIEKEKTISERKKADSNMRKAEKKRKLVEVNTKMMKREHCGDHPSKVLEDANLKINELQKQIHELSSNKKNVGELFVSSNNGISAEVAEVKLLKKQLKFEKERVKHAKDVARLEKGRSNLLQQELGCMKLKLIQLLDRLDAVDNCFLAPAEGIYDMEKINLKCIRFLCSLTVFCIFIIVAISAIDSDHGCTWDILYARQAGDFTSMQQTKLKKKLRSLELRQTCLQTENQFLKTRYMDTTASNPLGETFRPDDHLLPIRGGNCCESITGINAKLESLFGGSNKRMLQSSAINSSTAYFSDRQLVGSQERGAHSVTTSAKLGEENLNLQPTISSMSGEVMKNTCSENPAVVAENSVKSPLGSLGRVKGRVRKRKLILDTVECIETLCCESKELHLQLEDKLSVLHGMVQMDKPSEEAKSLRCNLQDIAYSVHDRSRKRRKASHEETLAMEQYCDGQQIKQMQGCSEHLCNPDTIDPKTMVGFEEIVYKNYMKLLDLDDAAEEECYRMAVERPVSPTLPEMEFPGIKSFEVDEFRPVQDENCERFSLQNENPASSDKFDVMNVNSSIQLQCSRVDTSPKLQHENGCSFGSFDFLKRNEKGFCSTLLAERAFLSHSQNSGVDVEMSVAPSSGDGVVNIPSESEIRSTIESTPKYCVMFSDIKDNSSLSRIFRASKTCMVQCSLPARKEFVVHRISHALKLEEELLPREKACVFFSLVLLNFCTATSKNCSLLKDFIPCLHLFAEHINEVISDAEARSVVAELCLDELLSLMEEFLIEGRVMLCAALSSETSVECDSRRHAIFDDSAVVFTHEAASADLLVAGSIILGSICAAADRAGFLCEAAYNIFRMHRYDTSVVLVILHAFAYVGGNKMFTLRNYSLTMTVLKSIFMFLESEHAPMATATHSFVGDVLPQFHACVGCPFSKDALSVDLVVSLLFTKLQNFARSGFMHQNLTENSSNSSVMSIENIAEQNLSCFLDMNVSCCLDKCSLAAIRSGSVVTKTLCDIGEILSLMELIACNMSWNWICNKIIAQLWSTLESSALENLSVAIIILLGQLGRIGVDAVGYEDKEVENLRTKLNAFLLRESTIRAGLPIQLATVAALLGLTSLDLNNIELVSAMSGQFVPANLLKNWFPLLTEEQQAISIRLFQSVD